MALWLLNYISIPIWNFLVKNKKLFIFIVSIQMLLLWAFFEETLRVDYSNYLGYYTEVSTYGFGEMLSKIDIFGFPAVDVNVRCENGWMIINWIVAKIGVGFDLFLLLHSIFCVIALGMFVYKYSDKPWLTYALFIALGFYKFSFGILRQIMTMCLFMYAIPFIKEKKVGKFLAIIFINFMIHRGSIVYVVLYFISKIKINRKIFAGYYVLSLMCLLSSPFLVKGVITPLLEIMNYAYYIPEAWTMNNQVILVFVLPVMLFVTIDFEEFFENEIYNIFCWGFLLTLPIQVFSTINGVFGRLAYYYYLFIIMLLPADLVHYKNEKIAALGVIAVYVMCGLFYAYSMLGTSYVPYTSIFALGI